MALFLSRNAPWLSSEWATSSGGHSGQLLIGDSLNLSIKAGDGPSTETQNTEQMNLQSLQPLSWRKQRFSSARSWLPKGRKSTLSSSKKVWKSIHSSLPVLVSSVRKCSRFMMTLCPWILPVASGSWDENRTQDTASLAPQSTRGEQPCLKLLASTS